MLDGRLTRLLILLFVVLAPVAGAATPTSNRPTADSTADQDITDMAADPTGQFIGAVVAVDASASTLPGTGGILPGGTATSKPDVYVCDYGPADAPTSGSGCTGRSHAGISPTPGATQRIDATFTTASNGGRLGVFAVIGPGNIVSQWRSTTSVADWTRSTQDGFTPMNVSIAPDASRVAVGTHASSLTSAGRIEMHGLNGTAAGAYLWHVSLQNTEQENVRPTALDWSRTGNVLAIGSTPRGVLLLDPRASSAPRDALDGISTPENVASVQTSRDGTYVVAAASNGVFLFSTAHSGSRVTVAPNSVFNSPVGSAQDVAITQDGARFAAAAGNKVHFFERLNTAGLARSLGEGYDTGARIGDIAFDETGELLVVVSGNKVFGFGPHSNAPMWTFDASATAFGGLDGPLRRVSVSDDAQRIIVAGKTKTMSYSSSIAVTATLSTTSGATTLQPTQVASMTLSVRNSGSLSDTYQFVIETPIGWPATSAEGLQLDPDEVGTVRFNVTAPAGAADGQYGVKVRVRSEARDDLAARRNQATGYIAEPSFNFTIPRSVVLKVEAPDDRVEIQQGAEQTVPVVIRNEGNAEGVVNLSLSQELTSGTTWTHRFEPGEQVRIPAGGSSTVNLVLRAPSDAASGGENLITIRAREGDTVEATDRIVAAVDPLYGASLASNRTQWEFYPGQTQTITLNLTNSGNVEDTYNLTYTLTPTGVANDWRVTIEKNQAVVGPGETDRIIVTVKAVATDAREATLTLSALSQKDPRKEDDKLPLALSVIPRPPTDEDEGNFLPAPTAAYLVLVVAALALARRTRGGRK